MPPPKIETRSRVVTCQIEGEVTGSGPVVIPSASCNFEATPIRVLAQAVSTDSCASWTVNLLVIDTGEGDELRWDTDDMFSAPAWALRWLTNALPN